MAARNHVFCVPFLGTGHGVNMFNVATTLANESTPVHVLVPSLKQAQTWLEATKQPKNNNLGINVLAEGKWEDFRGHTAGELFGFLQADEFADAAENIIQAVQKAFPAENCAALIFNGLINKLNGVAERMKPRSYILIPSPYYMGRLGSSMREGDSFHKSFWMEGIGGSNEPMQAELGDAVDVAGPAIQMM